MKRRLTVARELLVVLAVIANVATFVAMNVAAAGIYMGWVGPLEPLGKWASIVLLIGASAALSVETRMRVDAHDRGERMSP